MWSTRRNHSYHQIWNAKKLLKEVQHDETHQAPMHPKHIKRRSLYDAARTKIERKTLFWKLSNLKQNVSQHQYSTSEALDETSNHQIYESNNSFSYYISLLYISASCIHIKRCFKIFNT